MDFKELTVGCRTYRRFKQTPVPDELLHDLVEAARISSSAMNAQVLRYVVVKTPETVKAMQPMLHWAAALPKELGTPKETETPTAFIICCKEGRANPWADIDVGIAMRTMALYAYANGFGSCMLGNVEWPKVQALLSIPEDWHPRLVLALGVPDHKSTIVDLPGDGAVKYYLDEDKNYCVPKRKLEDICIVK